MQSNSKNKVIWLVILSILFSFIKVFEIPPVIPTLVSDLHISYAQAGLFMSVYAVMKCLASSPAGYISDKWGAVPLMSASLLGICIFGILGTIGESFELLLLWRFWVRSCSLSYLLPDGCCVEKSASRKSRGWYGAD